MSTRANPTIIGAFTLTGLLLAAAAIVLLGAGKFFKKTHNVLLYFDKSAYGLQVGSDVRFGGVRIGSVRSISVVVDTDNNRKVIPVVVELAASELGQIGGVESGGIDFSTHEGVNKAVRKGLRAGMKQQSIVTGQLYIEFDINPETEGFVYQPKSKPEYPVVPTIGTEMDELVSGIAEGLRKFNALDLDSVITELRAVLENADKQITALNMAEISDNLITITGDIRKITSDNKLPTAIANLNEALVQIKEVSAKANEGIDPVIADLQKVIEKAETSLATLDETAKEISSISNPRGPVLLRMQNVLQETERASLALKELTNDLKRNPRSIIAGKAQPE